MNWDKYKDIGFKAAHTSAFIEQGTATIKIGDDYIDFLVEQINHGNSPSNNTINIILEDEKYKPILEERYNVTFNTENLVTDNDFENLVFECYLQIDGDRGYFEDENI